MGFESKYINRTIEQIEKDVWPETDFPTDLVRKCYELRKKRLEDFTVEDLRLMIGQDISLNILVPLAIDYLKADILAEGDYYPGDLLKSVLTSNKEYWKDHQTESKEVSQMVNESISKIESSEEINGSFKKKILNACEQFVTLSN